MKSLCTLVVLALVASSASAADISRSSLASIGLPGFVKMSDSAAMAVRGKGYTVVVAGSSTANGAFGSGHASNSYYGSLSNSGAGSHGASGSNGSFVVAGLAVGATSNSGAGGAIAIGLGSVAGGASSVSVH